MARKISMLASGISPGAASSITGNVATILPAGTTQANAAPIVTSIAYAAVTAASTGVRLPAGMDPGDSVLVENDGANALLVYPPVGSEIATGATNAGFSVASGKTALFTLMTPTHFSALLGA